MNIYFDGDDHVYGTELDDPDRQGQAAHLANFFDAEYVNHAVPGSSVDQILWRTRDCINQCKQSGDWPDLIVLGFPEWNRDDWFVNGQYRSANQSEINYPKHVNAQRQQYYKETIASNARYLGAMAKYYNNVLYNLHTELFYLGIPHLFFNTVTSLRCDRDVMTFDWAGYYINPYQLTFNYRNWCRYQGFTEITAGKFHYGTEANEAWASMLYDYIQQQNLLTKDEYGSLYNLGRQRRRHYGPGVGEWDEELLRPPSVRRPDGNLQNHKM